MTRTNATRVLLALAVLVALVALFLYEHGNAPHHQTEALKGDHTSKEEGTDSPALQAVEKPQRDSTHPGPLTPEPRAGIRGYVLDESFQVPMVARIDLDGRVSVLSRESDGGFNFPAMESLVDSLVVSAAGFETKTLKLSDIDLSQDVRVMLKPVLLSTVVVDLENGGRASGFPVIWKAAVDQPERAQVSDWIDSRGQTSGVKTSSMTNNEGVCSAALGVPAIASIHNPADGTEKSVRVLPGQSVHIVLPKQPIVLQFIDEESKQPLAGFSVEIWYSREIGAVSQPANTDEQGYVSIAPTSFPILVRRPGSQLWQSALIPLSPGLSRIGTGGSLQTMISVDESPESRALIVGVRGCGGRVRLIDEQSKQPINASVRIFLRDKSTCAEDARHISECTALSPGSSMESPDEIFRTENGILALPCTLLDKKTRQAAGGSTAVLLATGYQPKFVEWNMLVQSGTPTVLDLELRPSTSRKLRVLQANGQPFLQAVTIYSPKGDVLLWSNPATQGGLHGPWDWFGGDILVRTADDQDWRWTIPAEQLTTSDIVTLTIAVPTGSIVVEGAPVGYQPMTMIAKLGLSLGGTTYRPTSISPTSFRFDELPVGSYLVGPLKWVAGAELQSVSHNPNDRGIPHATRTTVQKDGTTVVKWDDTWITGAKITGRVRVLGSGPLQPFLVPLYGPIGPNMEKQPAGIPQMIFGRRSPQIPLDSEGNYTIGADEPLPIVIAVCLTDEGVWGTVQGLQVIETLAPGESLDISTGSVELSWPKDKPTVTASVRLDVAPESLRFPLFTFHTARTRQWNTSTTLRLDGIPVTIREIRINGRIQPIELQSAELRRITVNLEDLAPAKR